jgi:hypothetical protein
MPRITDPRALRRTPRLSDFQTWEDKLDAEFRKLNARLARIEKDINAGTKDKVAKRQ